MLQGGGALGSYQGGVYQALAEAALHPTWVAGISIGAINAALIAGNKPAERVAKIRQFWQEVTAQSPPLSCLDSLTAEARTEIGQAWLNHLSALSAATLGVPGLYTPRMVPPWARPADGDGATSFYDMSPLAETLKRLVDFGRLNSGETRLSIGAVNIRSGNFIYFDTLTDVIRTDHILASAALPPGFPPVEVDGELYWDGGIVSNTPLQWVVASEPQKDTLIFQVDLWSARGDAPNNLAEAITRQKEIQYSSRTRASSDEFKKAQRLRNAVADLLAGLPPALREIPAAKVLEHQSRKKSFNIIQLIYHAKHLEGSIKDFEFSHLMMTDHWSAGYHDAVRTLRHPEIFQPSGDDSVEGVFTFDVAVDGRL